MWTNRESRSGMGQPILDREQADQSKMAFQTRPRPGVLPIGHFYSRQSPDRDSQKTFPNETPLRGGLPVKVSKAKFRAMSWR